MTLPLSMGGTEYEIIYSNTIGGQAEEFQRTEFLQFHLNTDLVCAMVSKSYEREEWKQQVLDALSPFQVLSKLWAASVLTYVIGTDYERSPVVYFGSWFGQQHSLMSRRMQGYDSRPVALIDQDPLACEMAKWVQQSDTWQRKLQNVQIVQGNAFDFDLSAYADTWGAAPIVVWNGLEHFDANAVKDYIVDHEGAEAVYLLQSTDMPAPDHHNRVRSCEELEHYFDGNPIFSAQLRTAIGSRFQLVFAT